MPRRRKAFVGLQKKPEPGLLRWWGVAKSLARAGAGPVVLFMRKKLELNTKSPRGSGEDGGWSNPWLLEGPADRLHFHSGIFFSYAKIFGPFSTPYHRPSSDLDITSLVQQQNHNDLIVLWAPNRSAELAARMLT